MSDPSSAAPVAIQHLVDEAGDPTLFDPKGRIIVGTKGCSKCFILGKLDVDDPAGLILRIRADREARE